jgi:hypothetical protein
LNNCSIKDLEGYPIDNNPPSQTVAQSGEKDTFDDIPLYTAEHSTVAVVAEVVKRQADYKIQIEAQTQVKDEQKEKNFDTARSCLAACIFMSLTFVIAAIFVCYVCYYECNKVLVGFNIVGIIISAGITLIACVSLTLLCCCPNSGRSVRIVNVLIPRNL